MIVTGVSEGSESGSGTGSGWEEERRPSARWVLHLLLLLGLEKESEEWVLDFAEKNNKGLGFWFLEEEEKKSEEVGDKPKTKAMSTVCCQFFFFFNPFL